MNDQAKTNAELIEEISLLCRRIEILEKAETEYKTKEEQLLYFQKALESATDAIGMSTAEGRHYYQNEAFTNLFGLSVNEVDGASGPPATIYADLNVGRDVFDTIMRGGKWIGELQMFAKDKSVKDIFIRAYSIKDKEGKVIGLVGIHTDITERKQLDEKLRESEKWYRLLFENMLHGFAYCKMLYDKDGCPVDFVYLDVNTSFEQLTGLKDVEGKKVTEVIPEIKVLGPLFEIYSRVALTGKAEKFEIYFKPLAKWLSISVYSPQKGHFVAVFDDITERKNYEEKLEHFAIHDQLTGLLNRHSLGDILIRTIAKAKRGAVSSLLYMDLDNFKGVNDTVGHSAGDKVLITLADLLKATLRAEDIVFRLGGDEFAVLLDGMNGKYALPAAERIRAIVEAHRFELEGRIFPLSLSIGLTEIDGILATGKLLSQADAAMYRAKAQGKNRVVMA
jgi:diguanylate cyclase (GGDEF)-like protein/PAS domain S-box-containing protein